MLLSWGAGAFFTGSLTTLLSKGVDALICSASLMGSAQAEGTAAGGDCTIKSLALKN